MTDPKPLVRNMPKTHDMLPLKPTEEMAKAGADWLGRDDVVGPEEAADIYDAMILAAPRRTDPLRGETITDDDLDAIIYQAEKHPAAEQCWLNSGIAALARELQERRSHSQGERAAVVEALAAAYRWQDISPSLVIAKLCDEHLDRSGRMLGEVRRAALALSPPSERGEG